MTTDDEQLCARLEDRLVHDVAATLRQRGGDVTAAESFVPQLSGAAKEAAARIRALSARLELTDDGYDGIASRDETIRLLEARLQAAEKMAEALKPFADCVEQISADEPDDEWAKFRLVISDYRRARAALTAWEAK